ncbi:N-acetylmuramoyl-L-alanine amidase [Synechococcus sp. PCC 6312]|uniref:N-acetylmuramoyl-L-alanine amidase n=1 Tax=Synechococcus sp. (strain ATCC 27167 / PCC 6312) TaxID=195253 RepID=UPI001C11036E|nr:N-acetylmuramoyl-L-alanine amidase [Synechococcus sp. PCC 6312]
MTDSSGWSSSMVHRWQSQLPKSWLLGILGVLLLGLPAQAGRLQSWRFNSGTNQLEIRTDAPVQPQAQLVFDPTRLVIDLPGVVLGRPQINQSGAGAIRQVRVAQFDPQTTRIVVELAPGYTLNPNDVKFRGLTAQNWLVQIPEPTLMSATNPAPGLPTPPNPAPNQPVATREQPTEITAIQSTSTGFFVATNGKLPTVTKIERSRDRRRIDIDLTNIRFGNGFNNREVRFERFGIGRVRARFGQQQRNPPSVRLTLQVEPNSPDWQIGSSATGGFLVVPSNIATNPLPAPAPENPPPTSGGSIAINAIPPANAQTIPRPAPPGRPLTTIQRVDLGGQELFIQGDRTLFYTVGWEGSAYRIRFRDARLGDIRPPRTGEGSPANLQIRQDNESTISVLLTPSADVKVLGVTRTTGDSIVIQLQRPGQAPPTATSPSQVSVPAPRPFDPDQPLPTPRGANVVVIDPGHGGIDPGAIGIGGIREKDIVLDIGLQVAAILQQQGVQVILTRKSDLPPNVELDLPPRVAMAERARAAVFVSIHANAISMSRPDVNGLETYYAPGRSSRLAAAIHNSILSSVNIRDRSVRAARFYVIRNTSMPAALVETGFVTGAEDAANFNSPAWRSQMAQAIARGILQFLRYGG